MLNKNEKIELLRDMVKINTVNGNERELAEYLKKYLEKYGIESKLIELEENRASLVAEIQNGSGTTLALSGHLDVVDPGDEKEWTYPPFSAEIEDGILWGRGASDMKSGLAALVSALIEVHEQNNFHGKIRLLATVGEEVGELGSGQLTDLGYMDDVDALIIAEPCNLGVVYGHKGSLNYKVTAKGVSAHSSAPQIGINAIEKLSKAIQALSTAANRWKTQYDDAVLGKVTHSVTLISGGTQVNSVPDYAEFEANVRTTEAFDNGHVISEIQEILSELNDANPGTLTFEVTANQPPVVTDSNSKLIRTVMQEASAVSSLKPQSILQTMGDAIGKSLTEREELKNITELTSMTLPGTTDAAQFLKKNKKLDLAVYGPGMPMLNHKVDERIPLQQYLDFAEVYVKVINKFME
ncbi:MAG: ArgE/DapE family deacylase [Peptoniphilus sp.]|nr:ArgE/DapE family deacylase [Peptoniphilus sp.]MDY3118400.1 ArgE/DapE family deacylase [Peptoniphilus sp.]